MTAFRYGPFIENMALAWQNRPVEYANLINVDFAEAYGIRDELDNAAIDLLAHHVIAAWAARQASPLMVALDRLDCDDIVTAAGYASEYSAFAHTQPDYDY